jgi:hypothetical protein
MNVKTKILTSTAVAIALTGGIGATLALADTPSPTSSPTATSAPSSSPSTGSKTPGADKKPKADKQKADKKHKSLAARGLHGEVTLGGKKHQVVQFQRGSVEKVSPTSVTVKSKDGFTATYTLTAKTKVHKDKATATLAEVQNSDVIRIVALKDGSTLTAKSIRDRG